MVHGKEHGIIERTDMISLIGSSQRYMDRKIDVSIDEILQTRNYEWQDWWFTQFINTGMRRLNCTSHIS